MTVGACSAFSDARISPIDERMLLGLDDLRLAAGRADEVAHPLGRAHDLARPLGIGADTRDAEELEELLHPFLLRLRHGGGD